MRAKDKCPSCFQPIAPTDFLCPNCELILDFSKIPEKPVTDVSVVRRMLEAPQRAIPAAKPSTKLPKSASEGLEGPTRKLDLGPELSGVPVVVATLSRKQAQLSELEAYVVSFIDGLNDSHALAKKAGVREFELRVVLRTLNEKLIIDFADEPLSDADLDMPEVVGTLAEEAPAAPAAPPPVALAGGRDARFVAPPSSAPAVPFSPPEFTPSAGRKAVAPDATGGASSRSAAPLDAAADQPAPSGSSPGRAAAARVAERSAVDSRPPGATPASGRAAVDARSPGSTPASGRPAAEARAPGATPDSGRPAVNAASPVMTPGAGRAAVDSRPPGATPEAGRPAVNASSPVMTPGAGRAAVDSRPPGATPSAGRPSVPPRAVASMQRTEVPYPGSTPEQRTGLPPARAVGSVARGVLDEPPPPPPPERTDPRIAYTGPANRKVLDALKKVKRADPSASSSAPPSRREVVEHNVEDVLARDTLQVALRMEQGGRFDEAIRFLERSISKSPEAPSLYNRLGIILMRERHDYRRAEQMIRKAAELDPNNSVYDENLKKVTSQLALRGR